MRTVYVKIRPMHSDAPSPPVQRARRPFGLNAIIVLQWLTVVVSAVLLALLGIALGAAYLAAEQGQAVAFDISLLEPFDLMFTLLINLVCAIGLWRRQRWAWLLTMLQLGLFMFQDLYGYFTGAPSETFAWTMLLNVIMVFYLNQREVQAVFVRKTPAALSAKSGPAGSSLHLEEPRP